MKITVTSALRLLAILLLLPSGWVLAGPLELRPRVIVITDIGTEPDDIQSMIRLLTYANDFDIEGLIASTSTHLRNRVHPEFIEKRIDAYGEVLENLRVHDARYPQADHLKMVVRAADPVYGLGGVGKGKHTAAAQLIIDAVDKPDPRPVWVSIWGGAAPLAEALWRVRESRSPQDLEKFVSKLRVYSISDQDDASPWARMMFPHLFWIASIHAPTQYGLSTWVGITDKEPWTNPAVISNQWLTANIRNRGPLGALYPLPIFGVEGDTPSFLYLVPNGLGFAERPDWGGWGGRYGRLADFLGLWTDVADTAVGSDGKAHTSNQASVWRWREDFQNDFAARMVWTVAASYADANHPPQAVLNGQAGTSPVIIRACPGETVQLSAAGSIDPDGQTLSLGWYWYQEASGLFAPRLTLGSSEGPTTEVTVSSWTQPYDLLLPDAFEMHIVLTARDTGTPQLSRYRRAVISILTKGGLSDSGETCRPVEVEAQPAATDFLDQPAGHSDAYYSSASDLGTLLDNAAARAVLEKYVPGLAGQAGQSPQARGMTLRGVQHFDSRISAELLEKIDGELAKLPPP